MHEWLIGARDRLAGSAGATPKELDLSEREIGQLLELARIAAHESGERPNAPLATYLVGLMHGRHPDRSLADLTEVAAGSRGDGQSQ